MARTLAFCFMFFPTYSARDRSIVTLSNGKTKLARGGIASAKIVHDNPYRHRFGNYRALVDSPRRCAAVLLR